MLPVIPVFDFGLYQYRRLHVDLDLGFLHVPVRQLK